MIELSPNNHQDRALPERRAHDLAISYLLRGCNEALSELAWLESEGSASKDAAAAAEAGRIVRALMESLRAERKLLRPLTDLSS